MSEKGSDKGLESKNCGWRLTAVSQKAHSLHSPTPESCCRLELLLL